MTDCDYFVLYLALGKLSLMLLINDLYNKCEAIINKSGKAKIKHFLLSIFFNVISLFLLLKF